MAEKNTAQPKAVASLILGIVSIISTGSTRSIVFTGVFLWFVSITTSIIGTVFGVHARKLSAGEPNSIATAGMICSIIGLVLSSSMLVMCGLCIGVMTLAVFESFNP